MVYTIDLTPTEEKRIAAAAKQAGLDPTELIKRLALAHLSDPPVEMDDVLDARLRQWQQMDSTELMPDIPAQDLLARWAKADVNISDADREAEDQLWEEIERELTGSEGAVRLRRIG